MDDFRQESLAHMVITKKINEFFYSRHYYHNGPSKFVSLESQQKLNEVTSGKNVPFDGAVEYLQQVKRGL